jgi:hypothetical protein
MQTTNLIAENIVKLKSDADATALSRYDDLQRQERCRATTGLRPDGGAVSLVQTDHGQGVELPGRAKFSQAGQPSLV